jgi:hypothetical protein
MNLDMNRKEEVESKKIWPPGQAATTTAGTDQDPSVMTDSSIISIAPGALRKPL